MLTMIEHFTRVPMPLVAKEMLEVAEYVSARHLHMGSKWKFLFAARKAGLSRMLGFFVNKQDSVCSNKHHSQGSTWVALEHKYT